MMPNGGRQIRLGTLLIIAGLLLQIAAAAWFRPAMFLLSAGVGMPLVVAGAVALVAGVRCAAGAATPQKASDVAPS
jgi:hypothetical protein